MTQAYHKQRQRIHQARQTFKLRRLALRIISGFSLLLTLAITFLVFETGFHFHAPVRLGMLIFFLIGIGVFLLAAVLFPVLSFLKKDRPPDDDIAIEIGIFFPQIQDRLVNALQVVRNHNRHKDGSSEALAEAALEEIDRQTGSVDYSRAFQRPSVKPFLRNFFILLTSGLILALFLPEKLGQAFFRFCHPRTEFKTPRPFSWNVHPGHARLIQGDSLTISVEITGEIPEEMTLVTQESDRPPGQKILSFPFVLTLHSVQHPFSYSVHAGGYHSPIYRVSVLKRPVVRRLQVHLQPPGYSGQTAHTLETNTGDIHALKGTSVHLDITASHNLKQASIVFENRPIKNMSLIPPNRARTSFSIHHRDKYHIEITDMQALKNISPITYTIRLRNDLAPVARITYPAKDVDLDEQMTLPLTLEAEDDFGFSNIRLAYSVIRGSMAPSAPPETLYLPIVHTNPGSSRLLMNHSWDLDPLGLLPQDAVSYYLEVWDNDNISGPKSGRSTTYLARFPSMMEIFEDVTEMQNNQIETVEKMASDFTDLEEDLQQLTEDLKANREISWEEKREIQESLEQQMQIEQQMETLASQIEDMTEKLEKNDLASIETLEKYQELQSLFNEIATPELKEAMKKFHETLTRMDQEALRQAAENMEINQEQLMKSLERTLALLKQIQIEQKVDELIQRAEVLTDQQEAVNTSLTETGPSDSLSLQESELGKQTESFEEAMQDLEDGMQNVSDMPLEETQSLLDSLEQASLSEQMEMMSEQIAQKQTQTAKQQGQQIYRDLSFMFMGLQKIKKSMKSEQNKKKQKAVQQATYQTMALSQSQETLMQQMRQGGVSGSNAANRQGAMMQGIRQISDSLYQLSKQMMTMSPQIGQSLGRAQSHMQQAVEAMQQSGGGISRNQSEAMGALNEAAAQLQDMLNNMQGGGMGGLGMDQFMSQLGNMSEQQMALNRKLADMMGRGMLSMEQQAAMARLAAEQRAIQKQMEKLMREYGERSDVAGRLGDLVEEMEKVIQELKNNQAAKKTIDRQERILSRMLEAQKSIHERDISRRRQARTGQDKIGRSPESLNLEKSDLRNQMIRDIMRLHEAGYTEDYQELIRHYFEALIQLLEEHSDEGRENEIDPLY